MILSVLTAVENALVITAIWKDPLRQLKGTPANYLILNLAISDLLIGIAALPLFCLLNWFPDETVLRAALSTGQLTFGVSHLTILSLAVERLMVITYPLRSADYLATSYLIPGIIMFIWFFAGLSALVPIVRLHLFCIYLTYIVNMVFLTSVLILILACYTGIYFKVRRILYRYITTSEERQLDGQGETESARRIEKLKRKERSVARTVFILTVIHLGCWIPAIVLRNLDTSCNRHKVQYLEKLFSLLHPLLNPLAYSLSTKKFQRALWRIYQGLFYRGNNETLESTRISCRTLFSLIKTISWRIFPLIISLVYLFIIYLQIQQLS